MEKERFEMQAGEQKSCRPHKGSHPRLGIEEVTILPGIYRALGGNIRTETTEPRPFGYLFRFNVGKIRGLYLRSSVSILAFNQNCICAPLQRGQLKLFKSDSRVRELEICQEVCA